MKALEFTAWMIAHPNAPFDELVMLFDAMSAEERAKIKEAFQYVKKHEDELCTLK